MSEFSPASDTVDSPSDGKDWLGGKKPVVSPTDNETQMPEGIRAIQGLEPLPPTTPTAKANEEPAVKDISPRGISAMQTGK